MDQAVKAMKLGLIVWKDAHYYDEIEMAEVQMDKPLYLVSAGVLLRDDEEAVVLAQDVTNYPSPPRRVEVIPKEYIQVMTIVEAEIDMAKVGKKVKHQGKRKQGSDKRRAAKKKEKK
jgi:hypothetical protein